MRLKFKLRQDILPKVLIATYGLPRGFFIFLEKGHPYLHEKSVFALVFMWQRSKVF